MVAHVLWEKGNNTPTICYRENWTKCDEHKDLSQRPFVETMKVPSLKETFKDSSLITLDEYNKSSKN